MSRKIYNLIILDRSGSMSSMRNEAVASVNETIGTIKSFINENPDSQQTISLVTFCCCSRNYIYDMNDARIADHIKAEDYQPCCGTPLYDAIGEACTRLHKTIENEKDAAVSVTIITDGYENASQEWNHEAIKSLIEQYKKEGWLFAYIGADHDVESVAFSLSIDNHMKFDKSSDGFCEMSRVESKARKNWMDKVCFDLDSPIGGFCTNYFSCPDKD